MPGAVCGVVPCSPLAGVDCDSTFCSSIPDAVCAVVPCSPVDGVSYSLATGAASDVAPRSLEVGAACGIAFCPPVGSPANATPNGKASNNDAISNNDTSRFRELLTKDNNTGFIDSPSYLLSIAFCV
jgi:hypothetical protein